MTSRRLPIPVTPRAGRVGAGTRGWKATEICESVPPPLIELGPGHQVACHHPENAPDQHPEPEKALNTA